ncbi:Ankyrin repeat-containing protein [Spathaspora sp. JA1]|nr:Ankyrin repeat-containing protein [Spathaspora sp. JA1]
MADLIADLRSTMIRENPARSETSSSSSQDSVFSRQDTISTVGPEDPEVAKAFHDICMACRAGDIEVVDSLLSTPNLDINQVDEYNYSPLILSSLCGHYSIVELLLQRGAVCDRDTFQGARCIYGALTDQIRDLLVSFDISKAVDSTQPFAAHIASLLNPVVTNTRDVVFQFRSGQWFKLHRFLLAARCGIFREKLLGDWAYLTVIKMPESVDYDAFKVIVDYIYLRTDSIAIDDGQIQEKLVELARKYQLPDLVTGIDQIKQCKDDKERAKVKHDLAFQFVETARSELDQFLSKYVWNEKVVSDMNLQEDVDIEDINTEEFITEEEKSSLLQADSIPDIIVSCIDSETESIVFYPVNKSILARSEYFDTMFKSDIFKYAYEDMPIYNDPSNQEIINRPQLESDHLPVVQITTTTVNQNVAQMILSFLYHDDVKHIPLSLTIELLLGADELFLERLKTMCAVNISSQFNSLALDEFLNLKVKLGYNAYDLIRIAWQTRCDKLEQHITKMIAYNIHNLFEIGHERTEFSQLIAESADRIKERQETDTIELIDDIRYYLSKKYAVHNTEFQSLDPATSFRDPDAKPAEHIQLYKTALMKYDKDIEVIDYLLSELQLDA